MCNIEREKGEGGSSPLLFDVTACFSYSFPYFSQRSEWPLCVALQQATLRDAVLLSLLPRKRTILFHGAFLLRQR